MGVAERSMLGAGWSRLGAVGAGWKQAGSRLEAGWCRLGAGWE